MAEQAAANRGRNKNRRNAAAESGAEPAAAMPPGLELRQTAAKLLAAVIDKKTSLDGLLDNKGGHQSYLAFDGRDRALLRAMLNAALRHRLSVGARLGSLLQKPLPHGARALEHILHIGAAQILYLHIPNHTAIDLAVESAKRNPQTKRFAALVNAVLRRLARQAETEGAAGAAEEAAAKEDAAAAVPAWFWQMLEADYGAEKARAIIAAQNCPPPLDISVKERPQFWAEKLGGIVLPLGSVRLPAGKMPIEDMAGFAEGAWWVQNAAASLPARLMGDISGLDVADLCAAPGGKTAQLAVAGARVAAIDASAARLRRLAENMQRLRLKADIKQADLRKLARAADFRPFDAALLDAPCSSTGTVRRHPDVPWVKTAADIAALAEAQADLLAQSLALVKSGGIIMFCNCSLAKREGEQLIENFLRAHKDEIRLLPFTAAEIIGLAPKGEAAAGGAGGEAAAAPAAAADNEKELRDLAESLLTPQGFLRATPADLPNNDPNLRGLDGFFAARLQKL